MEGLGPNHRLLLYETDLELDAEEEKLRIIDSPGSGTDLPG